jgi:putative nucleotidyltransferase with HDIG domain
VLGVVVQNESPGGWAISASGDPWLCVPASRRVCPEQSFEATNGALPPVWALGMLLAAQFICDLGANAVRGLQHRVELIELLREVRWVFVVDLALFPLGLALTLATQMRPWAVLLAAPLFGLLSVFSRERRARLDQLVELNNAYRGTALVLGDVVEADDRYTGAHSRGVVALAIAVGDALGLNRAQRRNLEFGALLHDVGKVAIPKDIINKPGKLDPAEWTIVKTHTVEGQRMLDRVGGFMREVGVIVRSHHERWDGSGYPDGLAGDGIPLEARIVACCDAWNAMTTTRSYRDAMPISDAVAEMRRSAGTQFDPRVVDALLERVLDHASSSIGAEPRRSGGLTSQPAAGAQLGTRSQAASAPPTRECCSARIERRVPGPAPTATGSRRVAGGSSRSGSPSKGRCRHRVPCRRHPQPARGSGRSSR